MQLQDTDAIPDTTLEEFEKVGEPITVTMGDVRAAKGCSDGARRFCLAHGIDWSVFLKEGVSSDVLLATGDMMALNLVEVARGRR